MRAFGQIFAGGFEVKSSQRESGVVRCGAVQSGRGKEGRGALDFRAAESSARRRRSARSASEPVSEESRPVRGCIPEVGIGIILRAMQTLPLFGVLLVGAVVVAVSSPDNSQKKDRSKGEPDITDNSGAAPRRVCPQTFGKRCSVERK